jgi:hypothetical protein
MRERKEYKSGRMLIDACKPFAWRERFPVANRFSADMREKISKKWEIH